MHQSTIMPQAGCEVIIRLEVMLMLRLRLKLMLKLMLMLLFRLMLRLVGRCEVIIHRLKRLQIHSNSLSPIKRTFLENHIDLPLHRSYDAVSRMKGI